METPDFVVGKREVERHRLRGTSHFLQRGVDAEGMRKGQGRLIDVRLRHLVWQRAGCFRTGRARRWRAVFGGPPTTLFHQLLETMTRQ